MSYEILQGDCLETLRTLPDACVQTCVTSPPYLGLRSYLPDDHPDKAREIGFAQTPDEYVAKLVDVFREVRRVLKDDGTLWLNLASSYNGSGGAGGDYNAGGLKEGQPKYKGRNFGAYKPKDLIPAPWLVAIALQQDGWWLRADVIWHKKAGMPENVSDRPTQAHEYLFLLAKSACYYYDAAAIAEPSIYPGDTRHLRGDNRKAHEPMTVDHGRRARTGRPTAETKNRRSVWSLSPEQSGVEHYATMPTKLVEPCILAGSKPGDVVLDPFAGAGTTGFVALRHHRGFIGCELYDKNIELAHRRIQQSQPTLLEVTA